MEFRPCIDIHNGSVKQIVGGSLKDEGDFASENFVSSKDASYYSLFYKENNITGGHIILLNGKDSEYYEATKNQAIMALQAYPGGMQIGGGITAENAAFFLEKGASHVIVTSYVFREGKIDYERLTSLSDTVGKEHLVLDVSCKKVGTDYYVVTDRWQKMTEEKVTLALLTKLSQYCDEFLIHAVDVEGKNNGVEIDLVELLSDWDGIPITYAGGVHSYEDVELLKRTGNNRLNVTVGSALDLFGGSLGFHKIKAICEQP